MDETFAVVSYAQRVGQFAEILVEPVGVVVEADYQAGGLVLRVTQVPAAPAPAVQFAVADERSTEVRAHEQFFERVGRRDFRRREAGGAAASRGLRTRGENPLRRLQAVGVDRAMAEANVERRMIHAERRRG